MSRLRPAIAIALVAALFAYPPKLRAGERAGFSTALKSVTQEDLKYHASVLSSDPFEGREAGTRGGRAARVYIVSQLKKIKPLRPAGDEKYFTQSFGGGYRNILAVLPGSDDKLKSEYIIVCAHYDHVGYGNERNSNGPIGYVHNGADDNASGIAGLLEIIEAFTKLKTPPKRSLLFVFWDAEEKGLLGSEHWVRRPTIPLKQIRLVLNMDMIGRLRKGKLEVQGSRSGVGFRRFISDNNREKGLQFDFQWQLPRESDHYPFLQKGVPAIMLHTGKHNDYHRPSDDANKLNVAGMQTVTRLTYQLAKAAANAKTLPKHRRECLQENEFGRKRVTAPLAPLPYRFGVTWEPLPAKKGTIQIARVTPNSPAAIAGLQRGDRIVKFNGVKITNGLQFHQLVLAAFNPVQVTVKRGDKDVDLSVKLNGSPYRVGIAWDIDKAEPETFIIRRVVSGSPAHVAGLRVGDRIHTVNGKSLGTVDAFRKALGSAKKELTFAIERKGNVKTVKLEFLAETTTAGGKPPMTKSQ